MGQGTIQVDHYLYKSNPDDRLETYYAPLRLPDGAEITQICLYARNEEPVLESVWTVVDAVKLAPGGLPVGEVQVPGSLVSTTFNFGYGVVCSDPMSYVFRDDADIDHDGTSEHLSHRVRVEIAAGATAALGGLRITWHRQVSPPPAQPTFADVPADALFFPYVEALHWPN